MCSNENDAYEVTWPHIYGGASTGGPNGDGNYIINSPFHGPSEMAVLSFFPVAAGSCSAYLSANKFGASSASQIAATSVAGNDGTKGMYFDGSATPGIGFSPVFFPVDGSCSLTVSNGAVLVTCIWRRKRSNTSSHILEKSFTGEGTANGW